jgi:signal transduction histidine kinase
MLGFLVRPYFWETVWFKIGVVAGAVGLAILGMHLASERRLRLLAQRHRRETELERERTRISRDMHDRVGASLTQITLLAELARGDGAHAEHLASLAGTAREAVTALDEIVWAVNPRHDNLPSLLEYIGQQLRDLLAAANIRCRLDFPDEAPQRHLSAEFRHNLFLLMSEAVNNAVKHAAPSEVRIKIEVTSSELHATVTDDGRGFSSNGEGAKSDGLRNMRARAADLGGDCKIESQPGAGTIVSMRLPWPAAPLPPTT